MSIDSFASVAYGIDIGDNWPIIDDDTGDFFVEKDFPEVLVYPYGPDGEEGLCIIIKETLQQSFNNNPDTLNIDMIYSSIILRDKYNEILKKVCKRESLEYTDPSWIIFPLRYG